MDFYSLLDDVLELLRRRGRVTYRALKRQFHLDDDVLDDLKEELIKAQRVAVDENGDVLVWVGDVGSTPAPTTPSPQLVQMPAAEVDRAAPIESSVAKTHAPEAERRQLTVLFCDLVDSTALASQLDPEEWREVVRAYQETCATVIQRYDGNIAQYLGDGLLVYFGYPLAHEDDAQRAVRASLGILEAMDTLNTQLARDKDLRLAVRVGIHSGPAVVGEIGGGERREQLALGDTPNIAARLQSLAPPNQVVISAQTRRLVGGVFALDDLGVYTLKGMLIPQQVYGVRGASAAESRFEAASVTGLTSLVGREEELALVLQRWVQAQAGEGQGVLLAGEPGIGKSRLIQAVRDCMAAEPHIRLHYQCLPYYTHRAFYPIVAQLERAARFARGDTPDQKLDKLEELLAQSTPRVATIIPLVAALLSIPTSDRYPGPPLNPERQKALTIEAFVEQLSGLSRRQPVLCIVEDVHWCDPTTLEVLDILLRHVVDLRVLLVITYRLGFEPPWTGSHITVVPLTRLSRTQVGMMVERLTAGKALPQEVLTQILDKTDGVPLFVEELTKTILESGLLHEVSERYALTGPLPPLAIPATLQDSLMARLDRLTIAKDVAQLGATIGRTFSYALLRAVSPLEEGALQRALAQLVDAELLYPHGMPPQTVYQFKHALIQEIAYQSLLKRTRQQYHRRILHVLEAQFPESGETQPELLAYHASEGVVWEKALVYFRQAASKAMSQSANHEAVAYLEQALTALHQLPARRDTQEHAIDIRVDLRNVLFVLGEPEKILPHLQEAERLAQGLNDHHRLGQVSAYMSSYFWMRGDHDRALTTGHRALAIAQALKDVTLEAETNLRLGQTYYGLGRYHQALEFLKRNMAAREPLQPYVGEPSGRLAPHLLSAFSSTWYVGCLAELGEFAEGMAQAERAVRVAEAIDQPYSHITAYFGLGYLSLLKGDLDHAIPMLERAVEICHVAKIPVWFPAVASYLGTAYALSGRLTEALVLLEQAVTQAPAINARVHSIWLVALGQAYGLAGRLDEAVHTAHRALQLARAYQERGWEAYAFRLLGEIFMRREVLQVEAYYGQALVLAEELEMRPLLGHCHLGLGTLYSRIGQREQACSELSIAIDLYRSMEMTFWLPRTEATLAQVEGR